MTPSTSFPSRAPWKKRGETSTFEKIPFEVQWGEGSRLDGCGEVGPVLEEGQGTPHCPVRRHRPVHVGAKNKHILVLVWRRIKEGKQADVDVRQLNHPSFEQFPHLKKQHSNQKS